MISHSHKFIFIHVFKTAGTSVRRALAPFCDDLSSWQREINRFTYRACKSLVFPPAGNDLGGHASAKDYLNHLGSDSYRNYFKFSFVRNPYDWLVSGFEYIRQNPENADHALVSKMSFRDYLDWRCEPPVALQSDFLVNTSSELIVDFIGHVETLQHDFQIVQQRIGTAAVLPWKNKTRSRKNYHAYYDSESFAVVARAFRKDFQLFGYCTEPYHQNSDCDALPGR